MSITVTLRYEGEEYTFVDKFDYQPWLHSDGTVCRTAFEAAEYMYTEGNYGCDCNRSIFLADHCGVDFSEGEASDDEDGVWGLECGNEITLARLDNVEYTYDPSLGFEIPTTEYRQRHPGIEAA